MNRDASRRTWPADLTDREVEVLRLIAQGRRNRQVADQLYISPKTVGRHVENIYLKAGVSTRAGAAVFAMEHRLLDGPTRDRFRENGSTFLTALQTERPTITAEDLQYIQHPVLIVTGSESPELMRSLALAAAENLPNARSIEIEDSGHVAQVEKPDEFAQLVKSFVQ